MSKFFKAKNDIESDSDSDSEPEVVPQRQVGNRFSSGYQHDDSDSESEDEVRVVRSAVDRALDSIRDGVTAVQNALKGGDWSNVQEKFEAVAKTLEKSKGVLGNTGTPKFYVRLLANLEDAIAEVNQNKETIKKMKAAVAHSFKRVNLSIPKYNKAFAAEIADFRAHPEAYEEDEESDSDEASDANESDEEKSESGSDDDDEDSYQSSSDSSSEEEVDLPGRAKWLKKVPSAAAVAAPVFKEKAKPAAVPVDGETKKEVTLTLAGNASAVKDESWVDMKEPELDRKLAELLAGRGKKNTDVKEMATKLEVLVKAAARFGARKELPVIMHLISTLFDSHRSIDDYMSLEQWRFCYRYIVRVIELLDQDNSIILTIVAPEDSPEYLASGPLKRKEEEDRLANAKPGVLRVVGSLDSFVARLEDEYTKSLQQINPHTQEYISRLHEEALLIRLAQSVFSYYRRIGEDKAATVVALLQVEHMYYKHDSMTAALKKSRSDEQDGTAQSTASVIESLCQFIFNNGDERTKTRALLCSVFYHALHDRFYRARDMFLMSHIQDNIDKADTKTQILFNRSLAQLGLSAFRAGLFHKAHDCLAGICSGRVKELLAQGSSRWHDKDPEHERLERRRQMPYHMHLNPDLLECCHFLSAMFLELPNVCKQNASPTAPNAISRPFRKYILSYSRQVFTGPPENIREHVLAAAKALLAGDLRKATDLILNLDVWNKLPAECNARVKEMLQVRLKEEAVRAYVILVGMYYESLGLSHICEMFQVEASVAKRIISKMIYTRDINAAWDGEDILVLYSAESNTVQPIAVALAEKISLLVESNERLLDSISGTKEEHHQGGRQQDGRFRGQQGGASSSSNANFDGQDKRRSNPGWKSSRPQNMVRYNSNNNTVSRGGNNRGLTKGLPGQNRSKTATTGRPQQQERAAGGHGTEGKKLGWANLDKK